ncbi:MAG: mechanosensitive ion channel [Flavobacteriales bacterium]|nr:mechanosensitive ion channel [Flavobacteriales bacterium]
MKNFNQIYNFYLSLGLADDYAKYANMFTLLLLLLIVIYIIDFTLWRFLLNIVTKLVEKSKTKIDDLLVQNRAVRNFTHLLSYIIALESVPVIFSEFDYLEKLALKLLYITGVVLVLILIRSLLHSLKDHFRTIPRIKDKPIESYIQVLMIFAWIAGFVLSFGIVTGIPIWQLVTTLGAASAIILLVFRDTILGLVASIQVSANDMVRIGDWITLEKYGADGNVIEINLATVKVQNFDNTVTTIPTYALISDSFKNWRPMQESGGRRIKRSIIIKQENIKFLTNEELESLKKIQLIKTYIEQKQADIEKYNTDVKADKSLLINGRNLTNVGLFRKYISLYLQSLSVINKDMTLMSRQLAPTPQGIPIEIYAFSKDKRWENYEYIMADIFDHVISAVTYFKLNTFELLSTSGTEKK